MQQGNRNKPAVQLPPIDRKGSKISQQNVRQNAQMQNNQQKETKPTEDKYQQMRNRSKNDADRLQKLKDIKSQYTIKKGKKGEKISRVKSESDQGNHGQSSNNNGGDYPFEVYEMERVNSHEENIVPRGGNPNEERDIEELERELAQLRNEIKHQELSIAELDQIQNKITPDTQKEKPPQPDYKNMVFGQRVKGKDMNDYWSANESKTGYKVQQQPGGQSQVQIGGDYNYFKDKENTNNIRNNQQLQKNKSNPHYQNQDESIYNNNGYNNSNIQNSGNKKHHPNEQAFNIINPSNFNEKNERDNQQYNKQQQQQLYSQQLREQITSNNKGTSNKSNQQSINIFDGYPSNNNNNNNGKNNIRDQKDSSPFINSLYYQQDKEQNGYQQQQQQRQNQNQQTNQQSNQQGSDLTADGKKHVKVSQPPGGRSQIVFF